MTQKNQRDQSDPQFDLEGMNPTQQVGMEGNLNMVCYAVLADGHTGVIYTDLLGKFPVCSLQSMHYMFVCYALKPNVILVQLMTSCTAKSLVVIYDKIYNYLEARGFKPKLNITDNKCSNLVQNYMKK